MATHRGRSYKACRECGLPGTVGRELSTRGLCVECREARQNLTSRQLAAKHGPHYDQWVASMADWVSKLAEGG